MHFSQSNRKSKGNVFATAVFMIICIACTDFNGLYYNQEAGANPDQVNPLGNRSNYTIFSRKELCLFYPSADNIISKKWFQADDTISSWKSIESADINLEYNIKSVRVSTGRITSYLTEQVVYAYYREDNHTIHVAIDTTEGLFIELPAKTDDYPNLAVSAGDLDGVLDDKGYPHDEIAIIYSALNNTKLLIFDYKFNQLGELDFVPSTLSDWNMNIDVDLGDFNGDQIMEIGAAHNGWFSILRLNHGEENQYSLEIMDSASIYTVRELSAVNIEAGDYDGDKKDEMAIGYGFANAPIYFNVQLVSIDSDLKITLQKANRIAGDNIFGLGPYFDLTAGLFHFSPDKGYDVYRRQLALYYPVSYFFGIQLTVEIYDIDLDLNMRKAGSFAYRTTGYMGINCNMTAANFLGMKNNNPIMDLAISYRVEKDPPTANYIILSCGEDYQLSNASIATVGNLNFDQSHYFPQNVPIIASDKNGDSFCLGSPAHIFIPQLIKTRYIMYEPPKHIDYLPNDPDSLDGNWSMVNVSRKADFFVSFGQGEEKSQGVTTTDATSYDCGSSNSYDAKESVKFGTDIASLKLNSEQKFVFGNSYSSSTKDINSHYQSFNYSYQDKTNIDDEIGYAIKALNLWRYPCYGLKDGDKFGFYEVIVPMTSPLQHSAGLSCPDWYQPRHENGNIFSYPYNQLGDKFVPEDLGTFSIEGESPVQDVLAEDSRTIDGNQGVVNLNWSEESGAEKSKSYESKLTKSTDISIGATAKVKIGWFSTEESFTADFSSNENASTGNSRVTKIANKSSKGISFQFPSDLDNNKSYHNDAAVYVTKDGTMKVAHAVDPLGSGLGAGWWKKYYWKWPDPALNLPTKYLWINQQWVMNAARTRKQMRGFFLHQKNPRTGFDNLLGTTLIDGDVVELTARVYNYCLKENTGVFRVAFSYVIYDSENGTQGKDRTLIGYADNVSLEPMEMQNVSVEWNTTGLGGSNATEKKEYVIYVTVDPDQKVKNDFHPQYKNGKEFIGGNNEGYWPWNSGIAIFGKNKDQDATFIITVSKMDVFLNEVSLALKAKDGEYLTENPVVFLEGIHRVRGSIHSDQHDPGYRHILFYDNKILIASRIVYGLNQGVTYVWFDWIPDKPGKHILSIKILEDHQDVRMNNNVDDLVVDVKED